MNLKDKNCNCNKSKVKCNDCKWSGTECKLVHLTDYEIDNGIYRCPDCHSMRIDDVE